MRFAYADPPYIGQAKRHYAEEAAADGRVASEVDHWHLIERLRDEYPDGWALSASSPSLFEILHICHFVLGPGQVRIAAWVKPFCAFKKGVRPAYAWEPVIFRGGRNKNHPPPLKGGKQTTPKDFHSANITLQRGTHGAKPDSFSIWILDLLNVRPGDQIDDLFPGSGAVTRAWDKWRREQPKEIDLMAALVKSLKESA